MDRCSATTLTGNRCKKCVVNNGFCWTHSPKQLITCAICLEESIDIDKLNVKLDCGHIFCIKCIYMYVIESRDRNCKCPMCRAELSRIHKNSAIYWGLVVNYIYKGYLITYDLSKIDFVDAIYLTTVYNIDHSMYITDIGFSLIFNNIKKSQKDLEIFMRLKASSVLTIKYIKTKPGEHNPVYFHYFKNTE